jgi:hypothetical protein
MMSDDKKVDQKKKLEKARGVGFNKIYATNVLVEETDVDVRLYHFNEIIKANDGEFAISDGVTIITPEAAVLLSEQLLEIIEKWKISGKSVVVSETRRQLLKALKE